MSGHESESTTDIRTTKQNGTAERFLDIMARSSAPILSRKEKKGEKERFETALKSLQPWYNRGKLFSKGKPKTVGELGWTIDEYGAFENDINDAFLAKDKDFIGLGAGYLIAAKAKAEEAEQAKQTRAEAKRALADLVILLNKVPQSNSDLPAIRNEAGSLLTELERGDPPDGVLRRIQDLAERAKSTVAHSTLPLSKLEALREKCRQGLENAITEADDRLGASALNADTKKEVIFIQSEIRQDLGPRVNPARNMLVEQEDDPDLTEESAQLKHLAKRYEAALQLVKQAEADLRNEIDKNKGKDYIKKLVGRQKSSRESIDLAAARDKFLKDFEAVEAALAGLIDTGASEAVGLETQVKDDKAKILDSDLYGLAPVVIKSFLDQIAAAKARAINAVAGDAKTLSKDLATLRADLSKAAKGANSRMQKAYNALKDELGQLDVIPKTGNTGAFASARQRMQAIRDAGIGAAAKIQAFNDMGDAINAVTSDKVVIKEFQSENNDILLAVKTVMDQLDLFDLATASQTFSELKTQAEALKKKADDLIIWRGTIKEALKSLDSMVKEFRKLYKGPETTAEQNAKKIKDAYDKPGVDRVEVDKLLADAQRFVYPVINNLQIPGAGQNRAIAAIEKDVEVAKKNTEEENRKKQEAEAKTKQLQDDLQKYKELLKETEKLVKKTPNGDTEELAELKVLREQVEKKIKGNDEDGARKQLDSIRKRLDALHDSPGTVSAKSLSDIQKADIFWDTALHETRTALDKINTAAISAAEASDVDPAEITRRIDEVFSRFQPFRGSLVRSMLTLADENVELKQRKTARENALRDVRAIRTMLDGNALMTKLSTNPFGVKSPFIKLRKFLADMEYNAMRAVPPE